MRDNFAACQLATEIAFCANARSAFEMHQPDSVIVRHQVPNVVAVRQNEEFAAHVVLRQKARNGLR